MADLTDEQIAARSRALEGGGDSGPEGFDPGSVAGDGGGGGGGSAPADPHVSQLTSAYYSLWGLMPPSGYVEGAKGLNLYEFILQERMKPAFEQSKTYRDEYANFALQLARIMGMR